MITKAIVEGYKDEYSIIVRVPYIDRSGSSGISTPKDELNTATICTLPDATLTLAVGDVVFVSFEDDDYSKPVILGVLYRKSGSPSYVDAVFNSVSLKSGEDGDSGELWELQADIMAQVTEMVDNIDLSEIESHLSELDTDVSELDVRVTNLEHSQITGIVRFEEVEW